MTTEANDRPEPVIWFEGTLIRDPQPHGGQDDWLLETLADADGPKITIHASGEDHSANIRDNAHKGSRLMVKGPDTEAAGGNDSKTGTDPDEGRITSRKTLYERFKTRLNENLDERKQ